MVLRKCCVWLVVLFAFAALAASPLSAATVELSSSDKAKWNKLLAAAGQADAAKLQAAYDGFIGLQKQADSLDARIKELHYRNEEALKIAKNRIRQINAAQLSKLETQLNQAKKKYEPLLNRYSALNKQISAASAAGSKELKKLLQTQRDLLKPLVQLAKDDIKAKQDALQAAKDAAGKKAKQVRTVLAEIDPVKVRIQAEKSAAQAPKNAVSAVMKTWKASVRNGDAKSAGSALANLNSLARQIADRKQKICRYEQQIDGIISRAEALLSAAG